MAESYLAIKDCGNPYFVYYTVLVLKTVYSYTNGKPQIVSNVVQAEAEKFF